MENNAVTEQEAYEIGVEAYTYFYSLVLMDATRRQMTNVEAGKVIGRGPMNAFTHVRTFPSADFRDVVRPNFDTLYSIVWLDLTKEPLVVSTPDTQGRYYMLEMLDMWTDVFACPGKRTTGLRRAVSPSCRRAGRADFPKTFSASTRPRLMSGSSVEPRPTVQRITTPSTRSRMATRLRRSRSWARLSSRSRPQSIRQWT